MIVIIKSCVVSGQFENDHKFPVFVIDLGSACLWVLVCMYDCVSMFCAFPGYIELGL